VTANAKRFTKGSSTFENITLDVGDFSRQVLAEINPNLNSDDYFVSVFLAGWEIWGGYKTDIEMKNLSLKGYDNIVPTTTPLAGDFDGNGVVNLADFGEWKKRYLAGNSTLVDFGVWERGYLTN